MDSKFYYFRKASFFSSSSRINSFIIGRYNFHKFFPNSVKMYPFPEQAGHNFCKLVLILPHSSYPAWNALPSHFEQGLFKS